MKSVSTHAWKLCEDTNINVIAEYSNNLYKNNLCNSEMYENPVGVCLVDREVPHKDRPKTM